MKAFRRARTLRLLKFIGATLCGLLLAGCVTQRAQRNGSAETDRAFSNREARNLDVRLISSSYGALTIATAPGASCTLEVSVDRGAFGDGPPASVEGSADRSGTLALRYPAPQIPPGRGRHVVACEDGSRTASTSAEFEIASAPLDPRRLHVRLERVDPTTILAGTTTRLDPSLVPARDESAAYLAAMFFTDYSMSAPELAGVNRFGLMVHPVPCRIAAGREVCATRFSDRELRAMGFADVPAPLADDCSTELGAADAEISSLDRSLAESGRVIDSANATLATLVDQFKAMESQYPEQTMPPDVRAAYGRIADTYDVLYRETNRLIAEYNGTVQSRNAAAAKRADLPC